MPLLNELHDSAHPVEGDAASFTIDVESRKQELDQTISLEITVESAPDTTT